MWVYCMLEARVVIVVLLYFFHPPKWNPFFLWFSLMFASFVLYSWILHVEAKNCLNNCMHSSLSIMSIFLHSLLLFTIYYWSFNPRSHTHACTICDFSFACFSSCNLRQPFGFGFYLMREMKGPTTLPHFNFILEKLT